MGRAWFPDDGPFSSWLGSFAKKLEHGSRRESLPSDHVEFAHPSEKAFAQLLDFYGVEWEYEPHEFAIAWDEDGNPTKFFRPDFYLPESDQYIEITTMEQDYVTKKNRKARLLREHYPEVRCKILYHRDLQHLKVHQGWRVYDDGTPLMARRPGRVWIVRLAGRGSNDVAA